MILIALNRSYTDKEFTPSAIDALPAPPIRPSLIAAGRTEVPQQASLQLANPDVLNISRKNPGGKEGSEESSINTAVEQKLESDYVV